MVIVNRSHKDRCEKARVLLFFVRHLCCRFGHTAAMYIGKSTHDEPWQ